MDLYPEELRDPPVPVVAFVGGTKLHQPIFKHLSVVTLPDGTKRPQFHPISMTRTDSLPSSSTPAPARKGRLASTFPKRGTGGRDAAAAAAAAAATSSLSTTPTKGDGTWAGENVGGTSSMPPQGVLKANWMWKHTRVVPAVAVFLFPEWAKEHKWRAKEGEFHAMLDSMRCLPLPLSLCFLSVLTLSNLVCILASHTTCTV